MKSTIRVLLAAALLSSTSAIALADGNLKVWYQVGSQGEIASLRAIVDSFRTKHPDIDVEVNEVDFETYRSLIRSAVASSEPPDVFKYWAGAWPESMVKSGLLEDIDAFWTEKNLDTQFPAWAKELNSYDGKVYGVPQHSYSSVVFYRKDLFAKHNIEVPADRWPTWDQVIGYADTLKAQGVTPFTAAGAPMWPLQYWLGYVAMRMNGAEMWDKVRAGEAKWTDPEPKTWFAKWAELLNAGYFSPNINAVDYHEQQLALFEGRAGMDLGLFNILVAGKAFAPDLDLDYFHFPIIDPAAPKMMHHQTDSFFMSAKAQNKENAKLWMEHVAQTETSAIFAQVGGLPPANGNVPQDAYKLPLMFEMVKDRNEYPGPIALDIGLPPPVAAEAMRQLQVFVTTPNAETTDQVTAAIEAASRDYFDNN